MNLRKSTGKIEKKFLAENSLPRLPLEGQIDLTYRCNNRCLHCWLWVPDRPEIQRQELSFDEIRDIADQARAMGCRLWMISGGEPLLRPDFPDIFDYLTRRSAGYSLNTNGLLITPDIARLLTRKGSKMIAVYGATADVYDRVTRNPGGFDQLMRGLECLKAAGAGFKIQLIPMKANWHQWREMVALAERWSPVWKIGAAWLNLSADGSPRRNREISAQRLPPHTVVELDPPDMSYAERTAGQNPPCEECGEDDRLFAGCIKSRRDFHVDPYGGMSWCCFIKDPSLRFDLRRGAFQEAWDNFIPSCAEKVHGGDEWRNHCGSCAFQADCRWCPAYAYLETGRFSAPIPYLCEIAEENRQYKADWEKNHRRYFRIAGITVRIESDLDFGRVKFRDELMVFSADGPGDDNVTIRHHFHIPDLAGQDLGQELYRKPPWAVSRKDETWFYRGISTSGSNENLHRLAVFNADHTHGIVYSPPNAQKGILKRDWYSLSLFPTDQIWLGPLLADREALLLHAAAAVLNGCGLVFVGHSEAGKSTTMEILKAAKAERNLDAEILCDDRNVIRKWSEGWRVHGTWSHGTTPDVSPAQAPLRAILFLEKARSNEILPLTDRKQIWRRLLATLIRPMVTAEWWNKELDILERLVDETAFYRMRFDTSGAIVDNLERLTR